MLKSLRIFATITAIVLFVGLTPRAAQAASITIAANGSASFEILWSQLVGTTELRALGTFNVNVTDAYTDFTITLANQTSLYNERVHSIGFNTNPNATSLTNLQTGSYFDVFYLNTTFPGFKKIDICASAVGNCTGGSQQSNLPGGASDTFGFRLNGDFSSGIVIDSFAIQFMGDLGSFQFEGNTPPPTNVPEPATMLLMGLGAVAAAASRRRKVSVR